jgi:hypothetical protein
MYKKAAGQVLRPAPLFFIRTLQVESSKLLTVERSPDRHGILAGRFALAGAWTILAG